ncbi:MAG TPA: metal-dependent hydrolase [Longimicrobiales bacterium]|nr:metal-dependent hydrolase [Longimicrobiales bacterium]
MARLTWHGHSTFTIETDGGQRILFDPFLDDNPKSEIRAADIERLDYILCSHGHFDHFADAVELAKRTGAMLVGTFELVAFAQSKGAKHGHGMNVGGGYHFPFGYVKLTPAMHSGTIDGDEDGRFTSVAHGFLLELDGTRVYYSGDTALVMEMQLLQGQVDVALLPIGDNFTMGPADAARAVEFIRPRVVIPVHYNTWDLIAQDPQDFVRRVGDTAEVVVLEPGGTYEF